MYIICYYDNEVEKAVEELKPKYENTKHTTNLFMSKVLLHNVIFLTITSYM